MLEIPGSAGWRVTRRLCACVRRASAQLRAGLRGHRVPPARRRASGRRARLPHRTGGGGRGGQEATDDDAHSRERYGVEGRKVRTVRGIRERYGEEQEAGW